MTKILSIIEKGFWKLNDANPWIWAPVFLVLYLALRYLTGHNILAFIVAVFFYYKLFQLIVRLWNRKKGSNAK